LNQLDQSPPAAKPKIEQSLSILPFAATIFKGDCQHDLVAVEHLVDVLRTTETC